MSVHWEGMRKEGFHEGRGDLKAGNVGDKIIGKSGGGRSTLSNDLISSPMSTEMLPDRVKEGS